MTHVERAIQRLHNGEEQSAATEFFRAMTTGNRARPDTWGNINKGRQERIRTLIYAAYRRDSQS